MTQHIIKDLVCCRVLKTWFGRVAVVINKRNGWGAIGPFVAGGMKPCLPLNSMP